jgi:hypothetical protein
MNNSGLFSAIWLHLPGTTGGIHVVYSIIEPLIDKYIKAVKPLHAQGTAASQKSKTALQLLVTLRILSEDHAVMIAENIADSWMILPVPLLIVTPGFIVRGGCVYTGLLVPALSSAKALAHVDNKVRCVSLLLLLYCTNIIQCDRQYIFQECRIVAVVRAMLMLYIMIQNVCYSIYATVRVLILITHTK